ncbi:MAG: anthranilate synthase component I [Mariprofundaceae bacterium]|nr:anthranilate synthase component I [Mariprofundaceae bacterium]
MQLHSRELSADCDTPLSVFSRIYQDGQCFLFESAEGGEHWGRYSILGFDPATIVTEQDKDLVLKHRNGEQTRLNETDMLAWLRQEIIQANSIDADDLPFSGGAVGYFSYEMVQRFECLQSRHIQKNAHTAFMVIDRFIVFDNLRGCMRLCVLHDGEAFEAKLLLDDIQQVLDRQVRSHPLRLNMNPPAQKTPQAESSQADYEAMVLAAKEYILAGDVFQVVLSQRFSSELKADPLNIYRAVRHINPSPYLFYMHIQETILVGSSPEILVRKERNKAIVRPIAGTRPRGKNSTEDLALEQELLADEKERAEHVMLVDLGRNDLGRVCQYGSVTLTESMQVERYSHVMHIVSQVEGQLNADVDALDLLAATFPAGTVSGAPKIRAMQIIDELEGSARGPYAGAIGYFSFGGHFMDTAITIRTAVIRDGRVWIQAGAGIVADSQPSMEHQECVNKATAMFKAVSLAEQQEQSQ